MISGRNNINSCLSFNLMEIASWVTEESIVSIPALQRGLVWKPSQVELLWDSLLRGFPVGSFMLSDTADGKYYLMDGQQRHNAISIGYGKVPNPRAILWLDICPPTVTSSSRAFWVKATTVAHPWGFTNTDECTTLSASERRSALQKYGMAEKNIYNDEIDLHQTWPIKASRPIPLQFFLLAPIDSVESFTHFIIDKCSQVQEFSCLKNNPLTDSDKIIIPSFYDVFSKLARYQISCNLLSRVVIENESSAMGVEGDTTALETLFTRLNTGGTRITQDDLSYSAIKAYWPDIKETNDRIAERYMPPAKLIMLAFRLALTDPSKDKTFKAPLSVKQIRSLAKKEDAKKHIDAVYKKLDAILAKIDSWLNVYDECINPDENATPKIIRTSIARNSPEVFLLLMYFAAEDIHGRCQLSREEIKAIALFVHWFSNDSNSTVSEIFHRCRDGICMESIKKAISRSLGKEWLIMPYSPDEMKKLFEIKSNPKWRIWSEDYSAWDGFINRVSWFNNSKTKEMLLFAQRKLLNKHFRMYDPARQDMWDSHNRPWDYDHITPQDWIKYHRNCTHKGYCEHWLWNIGNMAAIPFETNRSKSNRNDYDFYIKNKEDLLFNEESSRLSPNLTREENSSVDFARITFNRCCQIYENCYREFSILIENVILSDTLNSRAEFMDQVLSHIAGSSPYFTAGSKDYPLERDIDKARPWISAGLTRGKYHICVCWGYGSNTLEIGLRKRPGTEIEENRDDMPSLDDSYVIYNYGDNSWWYAEKDLPIDTPPEEIVSELQKLQNCF